MKTVAAVLTILLVSAISGNAKSAGLSETCSMSTAVPVRVKDILNSKHEYAGMCVRLRGLIAFRRLYDQTKSLYLDTNHALDIPDPKTIALYGSEKVSQDWLWGYRGFATVVGVISACDLVDGDEPKEPNVFVMTIGECHYHTAGPLIAVEELQEDSSIASRFYGARAQAAYGNLHRIPSNKLDVRIRSKFEQWYEAVRNRDVAAIRALAGWSNDFTGRDNELNALIDETNSPYRFLMGSALLPRIAYFKTLRSYGDVEDTFACMCKTDDCSGTWPISSADASTRPEWPYVCVQLYSDGTISF